MIHDESVKESDFYKVQFCDETYFDEADGYKTKDKWGPYIVGVQSGLTIENRFDEGLDTAMVEFFSSTSTAKKQWQKCRIWQKDTFTDWFVSSCNVRLVCPGQIKYYKKTVRLVELTKVLQSQTLRNLTFSRNMDGSSNYTVRQVLQRVIDQIYSVLYETDSSENVLPQYKKQIPLAIEIDSAIPRLDEDAPEMFFTELTVFEAFLRVGEYIGGMPKLLPRNLATGNYILTYQMWNNPSAARHTFNDLNGYESVSDIEGYAEIVESSVKNMLASSGDGSNALTYPCEGQYKGVNTTEFETTITVDNMEFTLPLPIYSILKVDVKAFRNELTGGGDAKYRQLLPNITSSVFPAIVEINEWKTIKPSIFVGLKGQSLYSSYTYNNNTLEIKNLRNYIMYYLGSDDFSSLYGLSIRLRVTYIPIAPAKITTLKTNASSDLPLPIKQIVNQSANIVQAESIAQYLQGLVDRMVGEYKTQAIYQPKGAMYPEVGDIVNGEIVIESKHTYTCLFTYTIFTTSKNFNRRSQFVDVPQEVRLWQIPADGKVTDTEFLYAEKAEVSVLKSIENAGNTSSVKNVLATMSLYENHKIQLAYIAWKSKNEQDADGTYQNKDYALSSVNNALVGKSVIMSWAAEDNASMGVRSYHQDTLTEKVQDVNRQAFISYGEKAKVLRLILSTNTPVNYHFLDGYTGTNAEGDRNDTFDFTFPMSNRDQYEKATGLIDFSTNKYFNISKDLRERILFYYQLMYQGKNGTIVGSEFVKGLALTNAKSIGTLSLWINGGEYTNFDSKVKGIKVLDEDVETAYNYDLAEQSLTFNFSEFIRENMPLPSLHYNQLAIGNAQKDLLLATNLEGTVESWIEPFKDGFFRGYSVKVYFNFSKNYLQPI